MAMAMVMATAMYTKKREVKRHHLSLYKLQGWVAHLRITKESPVRQLADDPPSKNCRLRGAVTELGGACFNKNSNH
jgi:hypothetical protein